MRGRAEVGRRTQRAAAGVRLRSAVVACVVAVAGGTVAVGPATAAAPAPSRTPSRTPSRPKPQPRAEITVPSRNLVESSASGIQVTLPPLPFTGGAAIRPDTAAIVAEALAWAEAHPGGDANRYFSGVLAQRSLDALCDGGGDPAALLGNLAVSGYFGGIWLRAAIGFGSGTPGGDPSSALGTLDTAAFVSLQQAAGDPATVAQANAESLVPLALLHGYNHGYLDVALASPPAAGGFAPTALACRGTLDCTGDGVPTPAIAVARRELAMALTPQWFLVRFLAQLFADGSVPVGAGVWQALLAAGGGFRPEAYAAVRDLSLQYLATTEHAALASAKGWADGDTSTGRCGIRLNAGLVVWSSAYFAGLAAPPSDLPTIRSPDPSAG